MDGRIVNNNERSEMIAITNLNVHMVVCLFCENRAPHFGTCVNNYDTL